jgi:hypothetical protein
MGLLKSTDNGNEMQYSKLDFLGDGIVLSINLKEKDIRGRKIC